MRSGTIVPLAVLISTTRDKVYQQYDVAIRVDMLIPLFGEWEGWSMFTDAEDTWAVMNQDIRFDALTA